MLRRILGIFEGITSREGGRMGIPLRYLGIHALR